MKKAIGSTLRRLISSAPGAVVLVVAIGAGVAYSAAKDDGGAEQRDQGAREGHVFRAGPPGPPPELSDEQRQQLEKFRSCMKENGVDLPEPPQPGEKGMFERPAPPSEDEIKKMRSAHEACEELQPEGFGLHVGPGGPCGPPGPPPGAPGKPESNG